MDPACLESLRRWVEREYDLGGPVSLTLFRSYTNDVFLVTTPDEQSVLKLYGAGWRSAEEIRYEIDLLVHLAATGIAVAGPIPGRDGETLRCAVLDGTARDAVCFTYAAGVKPTPPFTPELYYAEGRAAGAMHRACDDFAPAHRRTPLDLEHLLDRPAELVLPLIADPADVRFFTAFVAQVRATIHQLAAAGLDWGVCHGDLTLDNLHVTPDGGIVWYDFDSGGPGWRAIDLPGWAILDEAYGPLRDAFLRGYREVRPLSQADLDAMPFLAVALEIWGLEIDLRRRVLARGEEAVRTYLAKASPRFRTWSARVGFSDPED